MKLHMICKHTKLRSQQKRFKTFEEKLLNVDCLSSLGFYFLKF